MFILDTNVVSETMRDSPNLGVVEWLNTQKASELFLTAVTKAEILAGIAILPMGERQRRLTVAANRAFKGIFAERILSFDNAAASVYASIFASRRASGRPISPSDCQIAAIALSQRASIVTRDTRGFEGCGLEIVNPWFIESEP